MAGFAPEGPTLVTASAHGFVGRGLGKVLAGERELDGLDIALAPGGSLVGTVRDPAGRPVEGAQVMVAEEGEENLLVPGHGQGSPEGTRTGRTAISAADGTFVVEDLPLDRPMLATALEDAGRRTGIEREIVISPVLRRAVRDLHLQAEAALRIRVVGPDDKPVPDAWMAFPAHDLDWSLIASTGPGAFTVRIPRPGEIKVAAGAAGLVAEGRRLTVKEGETLDIGFRLSRGESISGFVVDERGSPLSGVHVAASPVEVDETLYDRAGSSATTDGDGRFLLEGLRPGDYQFVVNDGHCFRSRPDLRVKAPASGVRIEFGRAARVVARLRLPPGAAPPNALKTWDWTILDPGGSGEQMEPGWGDGSVTFTGVAPGRHRFEVLASGFLPVAWEADVPAGGSVELADATLDPGLSLEGRVEDVDGKAVPGARVEARAMVDAGSWSSDDRPMAWTDADGRFWLPHLPEGETSMIVSAPGFEDAETSTTLPSPPVSIRLRKESARPR